MKTQQILQLLLNKIPETIREAHQEYGIMNNLLSASNLLDSVCEVLLYGTGEDITYNGEIIIRG